MSADSYGVCPRCWDQGRKEVINPDEEDYRTLREYYEFYIGETRKDPDIKFRADYSGKCDVCKWEFNFTHEEEIEL